MGIYADGCGKRHQWETWRAQHAAGLAHAEQTSWTGPLVIRPSAWFCLFVWNSEYVESVHDEESPKTIWTHTEQKSLSRIPGLCPSTCFCFCVWKNKENGICFDECNGKSLKMNGANAAENKWTGSPALCPCARLCLFEAARNIFLSTANSGRCIKDYIRAMKGRTPPPPSPHPPSPSFPSPHTPLPPPPAPPAPNYLACWQLTPDNHAVPIIPSVRREGH